MSDERQPPGNTASDVGLSVGQVVPFLADHVGPGVEGVARLGQGAWSTAYAFRHAGNEWVARFGALREDFAKDRIAADYASPDLPIPPIAAIGEAVGGYYAISARAFGRYLDELDEAALRALLPSLFAALDAARSVDLAATAGYGVWGADGNAPHPNWRAALLDVANDRPGDRVQGWRARLADSPTGGGPFDAAFARLTTLVDACPEERHLVHSDLLNYNVLVAGQRIAAVFDWGSSLYGDFLYDLAWFAFWSPWYPAWHRIDFAREARDHYASIGLAVPSFEERLRCYQVHIGLGAQAYNAFQGRWAELEATARRTLAVACVDR